MIHLFPKKEKKYAEGILHGKGIECKKTRFSRKNPSIRGKKEKGSGINRCLKGLLFLERARSLQRQQPDLPWIPG
jgi:hypothetical protein